MRNAPYFADIPTNRGEFLRNRFDRYINKIFYSSINFVDTVYNWERLPSLLLPLGQLGDISGICRLFNGRKEWVHYRLWFTKELKEFTQQIVLDPTTLQRPYYDGRFLEEMMKSHYAKRRNFAPEIDKILSFEIWCRQNENIQFRKNSFGL